jgi:hypothetical protein
MLSPVERNFRREETEMLQIIAWALLPIFCTAAAWVVLGRIDEVEEPTVSRPGHK